jgi:hypothetical protein
MNKDSVAVKAALDEDNLTDKNVNAGRSACPNNDPFILLPSIINGAKTTTKWWINYWWGQNEFKTGTYVWGGDDKNQPQFFSDFDPKKFFDQNQPADAVKLKVFWDKDRKNPGNGQPDPMWITSEMVLASVDGINYGNKGRYGQYSVVAQAADFGNMDPWVTFGIFTYQFAAGKGNNPFRELDLLETISTAQQGLHGNAQFAAQHASNLPKPEGTSLRRFEIPKNTSLITAYMHWGDPAQQKPTLFRIYAGDHTIADITNSGSKLVPLAKWDITYDKSGDGHDWFQNIPLTVNERMHINFYVPHGGHHGQPTPPKDKIQEVLIKRFEYHKD